MCCHVRRLFFCCLRYSIPMRLVVILPAYNEEGSIADVLVSIPKILDAEIEVLPLVVNDGSTDDTVKIAKKFGAVFVSHPMRSEIGRASCRERV